MNVGDKVKDSAENEWEVYDSRWRGRMKRPQRLILAFSEMGEVHVFKEEQLTPVEEAE